LDISLKCLPLPRIESTRRFQCTEADAIRMANEWGGRPLPISATCFHRGALSVRLSGALPAVDAACAKIGGDAVAQEEADAFWTSLRDHTHDYFASTWNGAASLWRLSVKSTAPHRQLAGEQLIEWGGALRWLVSDPGSDSAPLRAWASEQG